MIIAFTGLLAGVAAGLLWPIAFPAAASPYLCIGVLLLVEALLDGYCDQLKEKLSIPAHLAGFIAYAALSAFFCWMGERFSLSLSLAVAVALVVRIYMHVRAICGIWGQKGSAGAKQQR